MNEKFIEKLLEDDKENSSSKTETKIKYIQKFIEIDIQYEDYKKMLQIFLKEKKNIFFYITLSGF